MIAAEGRAGLFAAAQRLGLLVAFFAAERI
jgi:hypothetical protein